MKIGTISIGLLIGTLVLSGACLSAKLAQTNKSADVRPNSTPVSGQVLEISFTRLAIKEIEKQRQGSTGAGGGINKQDIIFKDSKTWQDFWRKHSRDEVEDLDFNKFYVAGVFEGEKPSSGFNVEISKILYDTVRNHTQILVVETVPSASMGQLDVITYPADAVRFPAQPGTFEFVRVKKEPEK